MVNMALLALFETPELQSFKMVKIRFVCGYGTVGQLLYETHRPTTEKTYILVIWQNQCGVVGGYGTVGIVAA